MEKSKNRQKPNTLLKHEREKRGWSQNKLGELIGADPTMVSRWERGERRPEPTYKEKLCEIFEKNATELGLIESLQPPQTPKQAEIDDNHISSQANIPPLTRMLTMQADQLIERYIDEKDKLLCLEIDGINWIIPEVVTIDNTKSKLPITAINVKLDKIHSEYQIPTKIASKSFDILEEVERYFYDSTTIRLNRIEKEDKSFTLIVSKAHFLQYAATNYAMDITLPQKGWSRSLRDTVHPETRLCNLEDSLLANHLGVNVLVFTIDNYLIIPIRSSANIATWQQKVSPSISGATSFDDDMWNFRTGPAASWVREGREELGLSNSNFDDNSDIFLGLTRDLLRGGKPETFFATQLNITKAELERKIKKARDKWENKEIQWSEFTSPLVHPTTKKDRDTFLQEFLTLVKSHQEQLSRPAQTNLTLWFKYMWYPTEPHDKQAV